MEDVLENHGETQRQIIPLLAAIRTALIRIAIATGIFSIGGYFCARPLLKYLQQVTGAKLVAFGLPDAFFALLTMAVAIGLAAGLPYAFYAILAAVSASYPGLSRKSFLGFWAASIFLFALGIFFCLRVSLPYGAQFLLGYETKKIVALISIEKFVSFCSWVVFGFGFIFELPLVMILVASIGLIDSKTLARYRRYIIVAISIIAAILTPTPDIFNMMLMAIPLYLLFELGMLGMRVWGKKKS